MKPYYQDKWVTILKGDCRQILPQLDVREYFPHLTENKVDIVLTDPPWRDDDILLFATLAQEGYRLLKNDCFLISYTGLRRLFEVANLFENAGLTYFWLGAGVHLNSHEIFNGYNIFRKWKPVLLYYKGNLPKHNYFSDAFKIEMDKRYHEWGQAESSVMQWLCMVRNNDLILDPFLGSGTTCFCAKKLNRYSIGIEIEEKYCEIAARRCSQEVMELV